MISGTKSLWSCFSSCSHLRWQSTVFTTIAYGGRGTAGYMNLHCFYICIYVGLDATRVKHNPRALCCQLGRYQMPEPVWVLQEADAKTESEGQEIQLGNACERCREEGAEVDTRRLRPQRRSNLVKGERKGSLDRRYSSEKSPSGPLGI